MSYQGGMNEHFMVEKLVIFRRLNQAVEDKDAAEGIRLEDLDLLEGSSGLEESSSRDKKNPVCWRVIFPEFEGPFSPRRSSAHPFLIALNFAPHTSRKQQELKTRPL